jgi:hypothetical protein
MDAELLGERPHVQGTAGGERHEHPELGQGDGPVDARDGPGCDRYESTGGSQDALDDILDVIGTFH